MQEKEPVAKKGWLKTILGTVGGLLSGAVVMYATAAFNQVVKPAKPLANFKYDYSGNTVRFQNLSGSSQGWWDFGDGAPLEPLADRDTVSHTYTRPGDYTVKLSVENILGDESDRTVTVHLDPAGDPSAAPPQVASLDAEPVSPGAYAPATFKVACKVRNAQLCLLDYGDERPPEVVTGDSAERLVTFKDPGGHAIKLMAINGTRLDSKTEIVNVEEAPAGTVSAVLTITDTATRIKSQQRWVALFPGRTVTTSSPDGIFTGVTVKVPGGQAMPLDVQAPEHDLDPAALRMKNTKNLKLEILNGGRSVQLVGESVKSWRGQPYPPESVHAQLTEQQRQSVGQDGVTSSTTLALPAGSQSSVAGLPLPGVPADWQDVKRTAKLKLAEGDKTLWEGQVPASATFSIGNHPFQLSVTADAAKGQLHLDLRDMTPAPPAAN